jgi:hypothetical protein
VSPEEAWTQTKFTEAGRRISGLEDRIELLEYKFNNIDGIVG